MIASEAVVKNRGGRPRVTIKPEQVHQLRIQGTSWRRTSKALGIGTATAMRLLKSIDGTRPNTQDVRPKTEEKIQSDSRINP